MRESRAMRETVDIQAMRHYRCAFPGCGMLRLSVPLPVGWAAFAFRRGRPADRYACPAHLGEVPRLVRDASQPAYGLLSPPVLMPDPGPEHRWVEVGEEIDLGAHDRWSLVRQQWVPATHLMGPGQLVEKGNYGFYRCRVSAPIRRVKKGDV